MATASTARADNLRAEGNKALNKTLIFGFGKTQKYEDAAEHFRNAGNAYKLSNQWKSAGECFVQASEAYAVLDQSSDVTGNLVEAAQCYKKLDPAKAVETFRKAIDLYNLNGRFGMSSRCCKEMAEVYEQDNNPEMAMMTYQEAADLFVNDGKKSNANQCLLKVATIAADLGDLARAAQIYEDAGKESMTSRLGAYSAKGHFFLALMCFLAMGDNVQVSMKINQYKNIDFSFQGSRECDFIERILKACDDSNLEEFSDACADFDRITPLDPWKTSMLLRAKKFIADQVGGGGDGDELDLS